MVSGLAARCTIGYPSLLSPPTHLAPQKSPSVLPLACGLRRICIFTEHGGHSVTEGITSSMDASIYLMIRCMTFMHSIGK